MAMFSLLIDSAFIAIMLMDLLRRLLPARRQARILCCTGGGHLHRKWNSMQHMLYNVKDKRELRLHMLADSELTHMMGSASLFPLVRCSKPGCWPLSQVMDVEAWRHCDGPLAWKGPVGAKS